MVTPHVPEGSSRNPSILGSKRSDGTVQGVRTGGQLEDGTATSARRPRRSGKMLEELTAAKESKLYQQTKGEAMRTKRMTLGAMPASILGAMRKGCQELRRRNRSQRGDRHQKKLQHRHQQLPENTMQRTVLASRTLHADVSHGRGSRSTTFPVQARGRAISQFRISSSEKDFHSTASGHGDASRDNRG